MGTLRDAPEVEPQRRPSLIDAIRREAGSGFESFMEGASRLLQREQPEISEQVPGMVLPRLRLDQPKGILQVAGGISQMAAAPAAGPAAELTERATGSPLAGELAALATSIAAPAAGTFALSRAFTRTPRAFTRTPKLVKDDFKHAGAAQRSDVKLAELSLASTVRPEERSRSIKEVGKLLIGGRSIRVLDEAAFFSPTLKAVQDAIERPAIHKAEAGKVIAPDFTERVLDRTGHYLNRVNTAIDSFRSSLFGRLSTNTRQDITSSLRSGISEGPIGEIRTVLNEVNDYAREVGMDIGYRKNYFPRVYNKKLLRTDAGRRQAIDLFSSEGMDVVAADETVSKILDEDGIVLSSETTFAPLQSPGLPSWAKRRGLDFIDDNKLAPLLINDPRVALNSYIPHVVRRVEYTRLFGAQGEKLPSMMDKIGEELAIAGRRFRPQEKDTLVGISQALIGKYKPIKSEFFREAGRVVGSYQLIRTLPRAVLSSLGEPFLALELGGSVAFARGIYSSMGDSASQIARSIFRSIPRTESREFLESTALILDDSLADLISEAAMAKRTSQAALTGEAADVSTIAGGRLTKAFFKANLMQPFSNWTRAVAYGAGKHSLLNTLDKLGAGAIQGGARARMRKQFNALGIDVPQALAWRKRTRHLKRPFEVRDPYTPIMRNAMVRFINESVMLPRVATKPLWMSDPHFALIAQLKGYNATFGNTVLPRWGHAMLNIGANPRSAARAMATAGAMVATALLSNRFREYLTYGAGGDPRRRDESRTSEVFRAMDRAGFSGGLQPGVDAIFAHRFGRPEVNVANILGPTVSQLAGVAGGLGSLVQKGDPRWLAWEAVQAVPGFNAIPSEEKRKLREQLFTGIGDLSLLGLSAGGLSAESRYFEKIARALEPQIMKLAGVTSIAAALASRKVPKALKQQYREAISKAGTEVPSPTAPSLPARSTGALRDPERLSSDKAKILAIMRRQEDRFPRIDKIRDEAGMTTEQFDEALESLRREYKIALMGGDPSSLTSEQFSKLYKDKDLNIQFVTMQLRE